MNLWVLKDAGNNLTSWLAELLSNDSVQISCGINDINSRKVIMKRKLTFLVKRKHVWSVCVFHKIWFADILKFTWFIYK